MIQRPKNLFDHIYIYAENWMIHAFLISHLSTRVIGRTSFSILQRKGQDMLSAIFADQAELVEGNPIRYAALYCKKLYVEEYYQDQPIVLKEETKPLVRLTPPVNLSKVGLALDLVARWQYESVTARVDKASFQSFISRKEAGESFIAAILPYLKPNFRSCRGMGMLSDIGNLFSLG